MAKKKDVLREIFGPPPSGIFGSRGNGGKKIDKEDIMGFTSFRSTFLGTIKDDESVDTSDDSDDEVYELEDEED